MRHVPLTKINEKLHARSSLHRTGTTISHLTLPHQVQMIRERGAGQENRREKGEEYRRQGRKEAPFHSYMIPPNLEGASKNTKKKGHLLIAQ